MFTAHKIALDATNKQLTYFARAAGCSRKAYNWALDEWQKQYSLHKEDPTNNPKPNEAALRRTLNSVKKELFPWMSEVTKCAPQSAIMNLGKAYKNFWAGRAKYPSRRKKGRHDSFTVDNTQFTIEGSRIKIPRLGWVRMCEPLRFDGKILSATISKNGGRWFVSVTVDVDVPEPQLSYPNNQRAVGVDLGITALATLSTGEKILGPKPHKALMQRMKRLNQSLSRKKKFSANWKKAKLKLQQLHASIGNIRKDSLHKLTTDLTRRFNVIGIENLNVKGMLRNHKLARSIADMGFFEFKRQLTYKAARNGGLIVQASTWFPSSKTCSGCGNKVDKLPLNVREWVCPICGSFHDRDINAALNLKEMAVSFTVTACGEGSSGLRERADETTLSEAGTRQQLFEQVSACMNRNV